MVEFLNPDKVLDKIHLDKDMIAAEFGSGSGSFAIALAKRLEDGLVYALDIQEAPLSALKSTAQMENITNIRVVRCNLEKPEGSTLSNSSLDLVLIPNLLFQVKDKNVIISEAKRVLKRGGQLIIIDWYPKASHGPAEGRIAPEEARKMAEKEGFKLEEEFKAGNYHYVLVFEKQ